MAPTHPTPPGSPWKLPLRVRAGWLCDRMGQLALPLAAGIVIGYWLSDFGVRWLPTMLEILCLLFLGALLLILIGFGLRGKLVEDAPAGRRIRLRTVVVLALLASASAISLAVVVVREPSPLTQLAGEERDSAFDLDRKQYLALSEQMEGLLARLESVTSLGAPGPLAAGDERQLREIWGAFYDCAFALDQVRVFHEDWYRFDLSRAERHLLLRSYLLTYAAELALYEKSLRLASRLQGDEQATTFLDAPHPQLELPAHTFSRFREELLGIRDQARVVAGEHYLAWLAATFGARALARSHGLDDLWRRIEAHLAAIRRLEPLARAVETVRADTQILERAVRRTWYPTQQRIADWMGDTRTRRPGRYLITDQQAHEAGRALEPGDILLSRKNWYLSNVGLPGFWPHAILYLGPPEQLAAYFDTPEVHAYLQQVSGEARTLPDHLATTRPALWARYQAGKDGVPWTVIEAVSEGVILNTLEDAAGDYLAALRPRLDRVAKAQALFAAFDHLGKPYDFDFDFATDHAVVCTELVWRSYRPAEGKAGLTLPPVRIAGRLTLPANEIARLYAAAVGTAEAQLDFVYFLDAREREQKAVVADETAFRQSHARFKWDLFQR